jgi:hypothetical protein
LSVNKEVTVLDNIRLTFDSSFRVAKDKSCSTKGIKNKESYCDTFDDNALEIAYFSKNGYSSGEQFKFSVDSIKNVREKAGNVTFEVYNYNYFTSYYTYSASCIGAYLYEGGSPRSLKPYTSPFDY